MASDITVKVAVDGEAEFKSALKNINSQLKETDSELKLASQGMEEMTDSEGNVITKSDLLSQKLEQQQQKVDILQQQYQKAQEKLGELNEKWQTAIEEQGAESEAALKAGNAYNEQAAKVSNLGTQLNNAKAAMNDTKNAQQNLNKEGEEGQSVQDKLKDAFGEVSNVIQQKTGVNVQGLADKFTKLTGVSGTYVAAAAAVVAVLKKIADETDKCIESGAKYADDMNTLAKKTGVSTQSLQEFEYASELVDVSVDTLSGALKKTTKAMGEAQDGSSSYVETFEQLGVSWQDTTGHLRDSEDVFFDIIEALRGMDNEAERDAAAQTLLGKSASELNPLIEMSAEDFQALRDEAEDAGYVLSQDVLDALNDVSDADDRLDSANEALSNRWGAIWAPYKEGWVEIKIAAVESVVAIVEKIQELNDTIDGLENSKFGILVNALETLANTLNPLGQVKNILNGIKDYGDEAFEGTEEGADDAADSLDGYADSAEGAADATEEVETEIDPTTDKFTVLASAAQKTSDATYEANVTMNGIRDSIAAASGTGDELTSTYEKLQDEYDELDGAGTEWNRNITQQQLSALKLKATVQTLKDDLPDAVQNIEGISAVLYQSGTDASTWAGWYNDAFESITSGFDTLEVSTENTLSSWVSTMNKNNDITNAWNINTRSVIDAANTMAQEGDSSLRDAVQIMMDGGVEQYGTAMQELSDAIASGDQATVNQITSAITSAEDTAIHSAANEFMMAENLTEAQLQEMIDNGKVILADGSYEWADAAEESADSVPTAIEEAGDAAGQATEALVSAAATAILSGDASTAWSNGGKALAQYLITGMTDKTGDFISAGTTMLTSTASRLRSLAISNGRTVGSYFDTGLVNGLNSGSGWVYNAAYSVASKIVSAAKAATNEASPSKAAKEIGDYWDQGLILGMTGKLNAVAAASNMVAEAAMSGTTTNTVTNNTYGASNVTVSVYGTAGQDEKTLAKLVASEINNSLRRTRGAVRST